MTETSSMVMGKDTNSPNSTSCSNACKVEKGWQCPGGSHSAPSVCSLICGDGIIPGYRPNPTYCDDGNTKCNDGCSSTCQTEPGWSCGGGSFAGPDSCQEVCGDGIVLGHLPCDDGNLVDGDGCSCKCIVEKGYVCGGGCKTSPDICNDRCGDGLVYKRNSPDYCDDGNALTGDGCNAACKVEPGFQCNGGTTKGPDSCFEICGDGKHMGRLPCDDGNLVSGDGCDSNCNVEHKWSCGGGNSNHPDSCNDVCGDGYMVLRSLPNQCDDGNKRNGDGCDKYCQVEPGYTCGGGSATGPDTCLEICGDGWHLGQLPCDDGNIHDGDGCSCKC